MDVADGKINPLRKVRLSLEVGRSDETMDLMILPAKIDFIFGVGSTGLTPFECELAGKGVGETVNLSLEMGRIPEIFGHHRFLLPVLPDIVETFNLKVSVLDIRKAEQREIIRAMADMTGCSDHCCGDH